MTGRLTDHLADRFGPDATSVSHGLLVLDVEPKQWIEALTYARDDLGCTYFDWLSAVDELENGLSVRAHLWSRTRRHHLLVRTLLPPGWPVLPTASGIFRGANWHERETHEMFGVRFDGHPYPRPLLLPDGFRRLSAEEELRARLPSGQTMARSGGSGPVRQRNSRP
ncbi:NADH-quinone oxidoreductase subunit C [Fodinicola feengrottensis]|uniref:NADH-quinone oxidoreductase subunit C n=1 Tax=Fodinicola feengrottensis TaxID=435914 RepID=UPI002440FE99|nr:NADH-quinone oxidoreductase subunit C [Fodinicola feengrottensis]